MMQRSDPRWLPMTCEDALGQVGRQGGGHLVEHEDVGLDGQRAGQVDDPQRGEGQVAGDVGQVEVGDAQLGAASGGTARPASWSGAGSSGCRGPG